MARMYGNDKSYSTGFVDSSRYTNWILGSGETCHMTIRKKLFTTLGKSELINDKWHTTYARQTA